MFCRSRVLRHMQAVTRCMDDLGVHLDSWEEGHAGNSQNNRMGAKGAGQAPISSTALYSTLALQVSAWGTWAHGCINCMHKVE